MLAKVYMIPAADTFAPILVPYFSARTSALVVLVQLVLWEILPSGRGPAPRPPRGYPAILDAQLPTIWVRAQPPPPLAMRIA